MAVATHPLPQPAPRVLVGQLDGHVLLHFDRPVTWLAVSGPQALVMAHQLEDSARAAGAHCPDQHDIRF